MAQPADQNEQVPRAAGSEAGSVSRRRVSFGLRPLLDGLDLTPRRATLTGSTVAPSCSMSCDASRAASGSTKNSTQPPPPAPQTFAASAPFAASHLDHPVDQRRRNARSVLLAVGPFLAQQARGLGPVACFDGVAHGRGDGGDGREIFEDLAVLSVDVAFGHFPVVDPGIARLSRIGQHDACFQCLRSRPEERLFVSPAQPSSIALTPPYIAG